VATSGGWSKKPGNVVDRQGASAVPLLVTFVRNLRRAGVTVPLDNVVHYVRAIDAVGIDRLDGIYWAGRAVLIHRQEDVGTYDRIFDAFWRSGLVRSEPPLLQAEQWFVEGIEGGGDDPASSDAESPRRQALVGYSDIDQLRHKDFAACTPEELEEIARLIRRTRVHASQRSRRMRQSRRSHGRQAPRATIRRTLRTGGEVVRLMYQEPTVRPRRVVLLCDVSGSMEPYARALLRFLHVAVAGEGRVEAFAVGTRLTRLTRQLSSRDADAALREAIDKVLDWSGGTRLGEGIATFNHRFGMPGMARGAIVVILSDGLDRGDPALLGAEMARLHRAAHQTIWVNPLKASAGYEPLARGMAAALPHVDQFIEGHSAASLDALVGVIAGGQ
jgi:uncharacterized protein with von Willebrand factor type A (vWA) domain